MRWEMQAMKNFELSETWKPRFYRHQIYLEI